MDKKIIFSRIKKILIIAVVMISSLGIGYIGTALAVKNVSVEATGTFHFDGILEFTTENSIEGTVSVKMRSEYKNYDEKIEIPSTVERDGHILTVVKIKDEGFKDCTKLPEIHIPSSVTTIGESTFSGCTSLASVTLGNGVQIIANKAFYGCTSLTKITLPASLIFFYGSTFQDCYNLETIEVASGNTKYKSDNNSIYEGTKLVVGGTGGNIKDDTTEIGEYAFSGRTVNHFMIPESVNKIGKHACYNPNGSYPTYVSFENTEGWRANDTAITGLDDGDIAMQMLCTSNYDYYQFEWTWVEPAYVIEDESTNIFKFEKLSDGVSVGLLKENYTASNAPTEIKIRAKVKVDTSLTSAFIGFDSHDNGKEFTVTEIAEDGFKGKEEDDEGYKIWANITSIEFPDTLTKINEKAFQWLRILTTINIPASVTYIGTNAFSDTPNVTTIEVDSGNSQFVSENNAIYLKSKLKYNESDTYTWPAGTLWHGCKTSIIKEGTSVLGVASFEGSGIKEIVNADSTTTDDYVLKLPNSLQKIGNWAFSRCKSLTSVTLPTNMNAEIGTNAFKTCTKLASITFPTLGALTIKEYAFYGCEALEGTLTLPTTINKMEWNVFENCTKIETVASKAYRIGEKAFYNCTGLKTVTVSNCTSIGKSAFTCTARQDTSGNWTSASKITTATISAKTIGDNAFDCCNNLTTLKLKDGTVNIGDHAFGSTGITSLVIPDSVENIDKCAFGACKSLATVTIGKSVRNMGWRVFGDTALTSATFKDPYDWFVVNTENEAPVTTVGAWKTFGVLSDANDPSTKLKGEDDIGYVNYYWTKEPSYSVLSNCFTVTDKGNYTASISAASTINLTAVYIPRFVTMNDNVYTVTEIPADAFYGGSIGACKNIKYFYIPQGVTSIDSTAFLQCDRSSGFGVNAQSETYASDNYSLYTKDYTTLVCGWDNAGMCTTLSVSVIGENAFRDCRNIGGSCNEERTSVSIFHSEKGMCLHVNKICARAFQNTSLSDIYIGPEIDYIYANAFAGNEDTLLRKDEKGNTIGVLYIDSLDVDLRWKVSIDSWSGAFLNTSGNKNVSFATEEMTGDDYNFYYYRKVASSTDYSYLEFDVLSEKNLTMSVKAKNTNITGVNNKIEVPSTIQQNELNYKVVEVSENGFKGCTKLTEIILPSSVKTIGTDAFYGCTNLETIDFGGAKKISENYYKTLTKLNKIVLLDADEICEGAFQNCIALKTLRWDVKKIQQYAFAGCTSLYTVDASTASNCEIGEYAFSGCTALKSVKLKFGVKIYPYAFQNCSALTNVSGLKYDVYGVPSPSYTYDIYNIVGDSRTLVYYLGFASLNDNESQCAIYLRETYCGYTWLPCGTPTSTASSSSTSSETPSSTPSDVPPSATTSEATEGLTPSETTEGVVPSESTEVFGKKEESEEIESLGDKESS